MSNQPSEIGQSFLDAARRIGERQRREAARGLIQRMVGDGVLTDDAARPVLDALQAWLDEYWTQFWGGFGA